MLKKILPHAAIILSGMFVVFFFIDGVNPAMGFIDNSISKFLLLLLSVVSVINAVIIMGDDRKKERRRREKIRRDAKAQRGGRG